MRGVRERDDSSFWNIRSPDFKVSSICNRIGKRGSKEREDAKDNAHAAEIVYSMRCLRMTHQAQHKANHGENKTNNSQRQDESEEINKPLLSAY